ncbi:MAG TPA: SIS domain-containing protein [Anaerolineales bacterium]
MAPNPMLLQNILDQPAALQQVIDYQLSAGLPALLKAGEIIRKARTVVFASIGASYYACLPLIQYLAASGKSAILEDASELLHFSHRAYDPETVFVLVSRSGDTIEIVKLLELLKGRASAILGVTNEAGSRLARQADLAVMVGSPCDQMVAIQTYTGSLVALHLLGVAAVGQSPSEQRPGLEGLAAALGQAVPQWERASRGWSSFFQGFRCIYLLGRGASLGSAQEGMLLFHEIAHTPAAAMSAGAFRHGPWEVVDAGFRGLVFAPHNAVYELNARLAIDLCELGGKACLISPQEPEPVEGLTGWKTPAVPEFLASIAEIIPVQLAAYRHAEWQGLTPAQFRASPQVTSSETGSLASGHD